MNIVEINQVLNILTNLLAISALSYFLIREWRERANEEETEEAEATRIKLNPGSKYLFAITSKDPLTQERHDRIKRVMEQIYEEWKMKRFVTIILDAGLEMTVIEQPNDETDEERKIVPPSEKSGSELPVS